MDKTGTLTIHWFDPMSKRLAAEMYEDIRVPTCAKLIKEDLKKNRSAQYTWYYKEEEENGDS